MNPDSDEMEPPLQIPDDTGTKKVPISEGNPVTPLITTEGAPYQIPVDGSLGLLAMGYAGVMLWREKKYNPQIQPEK